MVVPRLTTKERLVRFYQYYAPEKIETAELALKAYEGREDAMFRALEKKYGPEHVVPGYIPPEEAEHEAIVAAARVAAQAAAEEEESQTQRPPRIPPVPQLDFSTTRLRLIRFYEHYAPEKVANVDAALKAYEGREEAMFRVLEKKYGPEPKTPRRDAGRQELVDLTDTAKQQQLDRSMNNTATTDELRQDEGNAAGGGNQQQQEEGDPEQQGNTDYEENSNYSQEQGQQPVDVEHPPFDYREGLAMVGIPQADIPAVMEQFGAKPAQQQYSAAIVIILRTLGEDALFDFSRPSIEFPQDDYPKEEEDIDTLAFHHICSYRKLFFAAWDSGMHVRNEEAANRLAIMQSMEEALNAVEYRKFLLREAVKYIVPIETERRSTIADDERLHIQGIVAWFRSRRDELLLAQDDPPQLLDVEMRLQRFKSTVEAVAVNTAIREQQQVAASEQARKWQQMSECRSPSGHKARFADPNYNDGGGTPPRSMSPAGNPSRSTTASTSIPNHLTWRPAGSQDSATRTPSRQTSNSVASQQQQVRGGSTMGRSQSIRATSPSISQRGVSTARRTGSIAAGLSSSGPSAAARLSQMERRLQRDPLSSKHASRVVSKGAFSSMQFTSREQLLSSQQHEAAKVNRKLGSGGVGVGGSSSRSVSEAAGGGGGIGSSMAMGFGSSSNRSVSAAY